MTDAEELTRILSDLDRGMAIGYSDAKTLAQAIRERDAEIKYLKDVLWRVERAHALNNRALDDARAELAHLRAPSADADAIERARELLRRVRACVYEDDEESLIAAALTDERARAYERAAQVADREPDSIPVPSHYTAECMRVSARRIAGRIRNLGRALAGTSGEKT